MRVPVRAVFALAAVIPMSLAGAVAGPALAAQPALATQSALAASPAATTYSAAGGLLGVAAASPSSAWAVGYTKKGSSENVLMVHWNGTAWSRVTSPKVLTGPGQLAAVTVVSAKDAWAVGNVEVARHPRTLILHWNGSAWSEVTSPAPLKDAALFAVTATATGGWAVGYHSTQPSVVGTAPLIFKLTGTKWSHVDAAFGAHTGVELDGVAVTSANVTLATGLYTGQITGVLARRHGSSWDLTRAFPESGTYHWLNGIAAGPHGGGFAVGFNTGSAALGPISIRWTGNHWVKASAPRTANLYAVAFAPGGTAWAAGYSYSGGLSLALVLRWNGHAWSAVKSPVVEAALDGLGFATATYGWAVGRTLSGSTLIVHWDGHSWN